MAKYSYTAEKTGGEVYKGTTEARDRFDLYAQIRKEGGRILTLTQDDSGSWLSMTYWNIALSKISEYDKILLARNLGAMLSAGLPLSRALSVIQRQSKNPRMQSTLAAIEADVRKGDTLNTALKKFPKVFQSLFVAMVRAGEESGNLAQSLTLVADQLERMYTLRGRVRSAMTYPIVIVVAIVLVGIVMMVQVVPTLANTFKEMNVELPASTQFVINLSDFLTNNTMLALMLFVMIVVGITGALRTLIGQRIRDYTFINFPLIGVMVKEVNAVRVSRTLSSLLSAGIPVIVALEITRDVVQNWYFRDVIDEAIKGVGSGDPLSKAFVRHENLYPAFIGEMMSVGEETGQTSEMLERIAKFYDDEVERKMKSISTIIEPFLMIVIGGAVGFFAVSMISPIYTLTQNV